jgi:hypothetical protein
MKRGFYPSRPTGGFTTVPMSSSRRPICRPKNWRRDSFGPRNIVRRHARSSEECSGRLGRIGLQLWDSIFRCISAGQNRSERVGLAPKGDWSGQGHGRAGSITGSRNGGRGHLSSREVNLWQFVSCNSEVPVKAAKGCASARFGAHREASPRASMHRAITMMCGYPTSHPATSLLRPHDQLKMRPIGALSSNATARK